MANTYTQLYIHNVFAVKYRASLIDDSWAERLRKYVIAIIQNNGHKVIAINNMPDHVHMFVGINPSQSISDLVRLVKGDSSEWINKERLTGSRIQWQEGYGAFSYGKSQVDDVIKYIANQQENHKKFSFMNEYRMLLESLRLNLTNVLYLNCLNSPLKGQLLRSKSTSRFLATKLLSLMGQLK